MNKKYVSFIPRALIGFVPRSLGILLALLVFVAFPGSSALATQCEPVYFEETGLTPYRIDVYMYTDTPGATIFFVHNYYQMPYGYYPSHTGSQPAYGTHVYNPNYPFKVMPGSNGFFKAVAWKSGVCDDSIPSYYSVER